MTGGTGSSQDLINRLPWGWGLAGGLGVVGPPWPLPRWVEPSSRRTSSAPNAARANRTASSTSPNPTIASSNRFTAERRVGAAFPADGAGLQSSGQGSPMAGSSHQAQGRISWAVSGCSGGPAGGAGLRPGSGGLLSRRRGKGSMSRRIPRKMHRTRTAQIKSKRAANAGASIGIRPAQIRITGIDPHQNKSPMASLRQLGDQIQQPIPDQPLAILGTLVVIAP